MNVRVAGAEFVRGGSRYGDYVALLKLRLNVLVVFAVAAGWVLAAPSGANPLLLIPLLLAIALAAGGASAINMALEAHLDRLMERTRQRPVAAGRVAVDEALFFGLLCSSVGVGVVGLVAGALPALLTGLTVALYTAAYTPLKTRTTLNTIVGAVPGAMPPLIGWTAAGGTLGPAGLSLFAILFCWQFPHFLAIASIHREDYARAGFRMLPVVDPTGWRTAHRAFVFALVFVPASLLPALHHLAGNAYIVGAFGLSLGYLFFTARAGLRRDLKGWRDLLWASLICLPGLFFLMMFDRLP